MTVHVSRIVRERATLEVAGETVTEVVAYVETQAKRNGLAIFPATWTREKVLERPCVEFVEAEHDA